MNLTAAQPDLARSAGIMLFRKGVRPEPSGLPVSGS